MNLIRRFARHWRLSASSYIRPHSPPFLILFISSMCNMKCEHCFYWRSLNHGDDLSIADIVALSRSLGRIENLSLSGGEPFARHEFSEICRQFIRQNGVQQIYVPTNGWYTERTINQVRATLTERGLELLVLELSLDGTPEFHDRFRAVSGAFARVMQTYDALAALQAEDPRLRIHSISTATNTNVDEIRALTTYLFERCPQMDHHNLAIIRGDSRNPSLLAPDVAAYTGLYQYVRRLWLSRETGRYGAIVEPMLQWAKVETVSRPRQVAPCRAGTLCGVVYANGDVAVCELHPPIGNVRQKPFPQIWRSAAARQQLRSIAHKQCHCTTEVFLWPSIVFHPPSLARALVGSRAWQSVKPLDPGERTPIPSYEGEHLALPAAEPAQTPKQAR